MSGGGQARASRVIPALAYALGYQKQVELCAAEADFPAYFAWHYPPPFLFVASFLRAVSLTPRPSSAEVFRSASCLFAVIARDRRHAHLAFMLAIEFSSHAEAHFGRADGFFTAALIRRDALILLPTRKVLAEFARC